MPSIRELQIISIRPNRADVIITELTMMDVLVLHEATADGENTRVDDGPYDQHTVVQSEATVQVEKQCSRSLDD